MASHVLPKNTPRLNDEVIRPSLRHQASIAEKVLRELASLKLTVALFAMAIFIIWAGTLAQKESGVWVAIGQYFRTWFAFVEFKIFCFFLAKPPDWTTGFYFPGGRLIGVAMAVNLLAAHGVRFKLQARDWRLPAGLAVIAAGIGLLGLVVVVGNHLSGVQAGSPVEWPTLWFILKLGLAAVVGAGIARLAVMDWSRRFERYLLLGGTVCLGSLLAWLLYRSDFVPDPSSLRIVWQLIEGEAVGLTLLAGCMLLFKKRAGIVLIHAGIGLMMFNELFVDMTSKEPQLLRIQEGHARNYTEDIRSCELALIDSSDADKDDVIVVPKGKLQPGATIRDPKLPFDIQVTAFFQNATIRRVKLTDKNLATDGAGLAEIALKEKPVSGTETSGRVDSPAAYVKLLKSGTSKSLGTFLVSGMLLPTANKIDLGNRSYDLSLRFKRTYKPYAVRLVKTEETDWPGTNNPRYFSSDIHLISDTLHENRHDHIWMNNPLRFGGETFYQSGYEQDPETGEKFSTLSVVDNTGWMIPYIGCMIVATGLGAHFLGTLFRFMRRQSAPPPIASKTDREIPENRRGLSPFTESAEQKGTVPLSAEKSPAMTTAAAYFPWIVVAISAALALSRLIPPSSPPDAMHLYEFGALPMVNEGRTKPIDTFAVTSLWSISDRQSFIDENGQKRPAIQWLLDVIADPQAADKHQVFYIFNPELLDSLGLTRTESHFYSIAEINKHARERKNGEKKADADDDNGPTQAESLFKFLRPQLEQADAVEPQNRNPYQEKLLDLARRLMAYIELQRAFDDARIPKFNEQEIKQQPQAAYEQTLEIIRRWDRPPKDNERQEKPKPLVVPIAGLDEVWHSYPAAQALAHVNAITGLQPANEATKSFEAILAAYGKHNVADFNAELAKYRTKLESDPPKLLEPGIVNFEAFFNHFAPFETAWGLYLLAILLALLGLLLWNFEWSIPIQKAAFGMIVVALALHTFALIARIHISGRPPVTTLYSAAVFIAWGGVVLGIVMELVYRVGLGNLIAAAAGAAGLGLAGLIFQYLDAGKDTIVVP
jgi:hypothetical protein